MEGTTKREREGGRERKREGGEGGKEIWRMEK